LALPNHLNLQTHYHHFFLNGDAIREWLTLLMKELFGCNAWRHSWMAPPLMKLLFMHIYIEEGCNLIPGR